MKKRPSKTLLATIALTFTLGAGVAWARNVVTTTAGCKQEFGSASKLCEKCVKGKGKWTQHAAKKGVWSCVGLPPNASVLLKQTVID